MSLETETSGVALRQRAFQRCLSERNIALLHCGLDSVCDLAENLPDAWPSRAPLGLDDRGTLPPELAAPVIAAKAMALASGAPQRIELEVGGPPRRLFLLQLSPDREDDGRVAGLFTVLTDITELREGERALTSLLREVSHRSKNLLAIVQSVAMQTASHSDGNDDFLDKLRGRLQALASAQDLVTENNWQGTPFHALVAAQLSRVGQASLQAIRITGDNPLLRPNAALHVGLALHELATNALLHGALSGRQPGVVAVAARLSPRRGARRTLDIEWTETTAQEAASRGGHFGTMVLERIVPLSVGGSAYYEVAPDRVTYRLTIPATQFDA